MKTSPHHYFDVVETFPSVSIAPMHDGLPVEVSLIAQLGHGAGNAVYESVLARQKNHQYFVNELDEPSAKLGGVNAEKGDMTSLYTFIVGTKGHPFHRHAGHRIFTAIAGSGGAQLRFSTASTQDINDNPNSFVERLHYVNIPADCLFTVRFGGETWHQFVPLKPNQSHPTFIALSSHTNELGGIETAELQQKVLANQASIPNLTELLPTEVQAILDSDDFFKRIVTTTSLALDAPEGTFHRLFCTCVRASSGFLRGLFARNRKPVGYVSNVKVDRHD